MRATAACICGSDLWPYGSMSPADGPHGWEHEFIGPVSDTESHLGADAFGRTRAGRWIASVGARMVFSFAATHGAGPASAAFSIAHHIIGSAREAADAEMPLMHVHLRGCSACRDDYASLLALLPEP